MSTSKEAHLDHVDLSNYLPVSHVPLFSKMSEQAVGGPPKVLLDELDCLDPFQPGFRSGYELPW